MNQSEKFWNKLSKNYEKMAKDKTFIIVLNKIRKYLNPDDIVLDFACATGLYSVELAANVKEIQAFDCSSKMIDIAKSKTIENRKDNIYFSQTTLFDEKYKKETFDAILALNILLYMDDLQKVIQRMGELLKPEGFIITSTAYLGEKRTFIGIILSSIIFILTKLKMLPYVRFFKKFELEKAFTGEGFKIVESDIFSDYPATECFIVIQKENKK
jgi:2-polyprenyl-3-methyl-5-hydroxy-6-metoxy-1,4-benzoquinol methylase